MNLPEGVRQETACMLIALREFFDDPNWYDESIVSNIRNNIDTSGTGGSAGWYGSSDDFRKEAQRLGLWCESCWIPPQSGNDDYFTAHDNGKRLRWSRNARMLLICKIDEGSAHAICIRASQFNMYSGKVLNFAMEKRGMIVDQIK